MNYSKYNFKKVFKLVHKASYMLSHTGSLSTITNLGIKHIAPAINVKTVLGTVTLKNHLKRGLTHHLTCCTLFLLFV